MFVQEQLREIGVRMEIRNLELNVLRERVRSGDFDAAIVLTLASPVAPLNHSELLGEGSLINYDNPRIRELLDVAGTTVDPTEYDRIYEEIGLILQDELPLTLLYNTVWATVAHRRVKGLSTPFRADPVWYAADLWLEEPGK